MSTHSAQSSVSSDTPKLSLVATFDDVNRLNDILNDGYGEECFLRFLNNMDWCRQQWAAAESEAKRLQRELDDALAALSGWESKFANARKLLDSEKKERKIAIEKCHSLEKQMMLARDLLFNDNRNKLNDETLEKLAFLNGTRCSVTDQGKLDAIPEFNSTGTFLMDASVSRSEDDLDSSVRHSYIRPRLSGIRSPLRSHNAPENPPAKKRRSSNSTSNTQVVEVDGGRVLAKATTTLTLEQTPAEKAPNNMHYIKEEEITTDTDSDPTPARGNPPRTVTSTIRTHLTPFAPSTPFSPSAPLKTDSESASDATPRRGLETRGSVRGDAWGSPRTQMRSHTFVSKALYCSEQCQVCDKKIRFAKMCLRCEVCRATSHPKCSHLLPLPCIPHKATPYTADNQMSIADYAPSSPPMVPALLVHCINEVEKRGLSEMGLYRVSGSDKDIKKLKEKFLRGRGAPPLGEEDVHVLCGCIKDFIRCLREPLITHSLWPDFMSVAELSERGDVTATLVQAVSQLPPPNRDTLAFLILHLQRVAESVECKMPVSNLAKVFSPTIVGYADTEANEMYTQTSKLLVVMELLLTLPSEYWAQFAGGHVLCPPSSPALRPARLPASAPRPPAFASRGPNTPRPPHTPVHRTKGFFYKTTVTEPASRRRFFD